MTYGHVQEGFFMFKRLFDSRFQLRCFAVVAAILLAAILFVSPVQLPVMLYKLALVTVAAIVGVFFDFALFPFATPASYLDDDWRDNPDAHNPCDADYPIADGYLSVFVGACLRRAAIVAAFVLAVSVGL